MRLHSVVDAVCFSFFLPVVAILHVNLIDLNVLGKAVHSETYFNYLYFTHTSVTSWLIDLAIKRGISFVDCYYD